MIINDSYQPIFTTSGAMLPTKDVVAAANYASSSKSSTKGQMYLSQTRIPKVGSPLHTTRLPLTEKPSPFVHSGAANGSQHRRSQAAAMVTNNNATAAAVGNYEVTSNRSKTSGSKNLLMPQIPTSMVAAQRKVHVASTLSEAKMRRLT